MNKQLNWILWIALVLLSVPTQTQAYYDPAPQRWINRDPLREPGFEVLRGGKSIPALTSIRTRIRSDSGNLDGFVRNNPVLYYDAFGLTPERGPSTLACKQAEEQAEAALELAEAEPSDENVEAALLASLNAAYWCTPPRKPPVWKRCLRGAGQILRGAGEILLRFPVFILDPCITNPWLPGCGGGNEPPMA